MDMLTLEDSLADILPAGFSFGQDRHGQLVIYTNLVEEEDGELVSFEGDEEIDFDPDLQQLEDEDEED